MLLAPLHALLLLAAPAPAASAAPSAALPVEELVRRAADCGDASLAREIAELARLIKGYGDTHARGTANYQRIVETLVEPALARHIVGASAEVRRAREAALADPEGASLGNVLASAVVPSAVVNGTATAVPAKTPPV